MKAFLHNRRGQCHQDEAMSALACGLKKHGVEVQRSNSWDSTDADFVVCWGDKVPDGIPQPRLILEAGYINGRSGDYVRDRLRFVSVGWDVMHGRGRPGPCDLPPDRLRAAHVDVLPWRESGDYVLICGQHPGDACAPSVDNEKWRRAFDHAAQLGRVVFRPHPLMSQKMRPLHEALAGARRCVTWSSTAAIEAVIMGVPTVALDRGSMAWPVTSHGVLEKPWTGNRLPWLRWLCYRQWTHAELKSGAAWSFLENGLVDSNCANV